MWSWAVAAGVLQVWARGVHGGETMQKAVNSISALLRAPRAACWVLLNSISLYWRTNWKSVTFSSSTHSGGTIKGDNCCLALNSRTPNIFFPLPFLNTSGLWCHLLRQRRASVSSTLLKSNGARGSSFFWDVCCRHHNQAEHSTILVEKLGIFFFICFFLLL